MKQANRSVMGALLFALITAGTSLGALAVEPIQFSADMVRRGPSGETSAGKMFVGEGRTRLEMTQQGRQVVRINDQVRGMEWILFPSDKNYLERATPKPQGAGAATPPAAPTAPAAERDPCVGLPPSATCRRVGVEDVHGRSAVKWEIVIVEQGQTLTGTQWIDQERGLPLRSLMPDGQTLELKVVAREQLDGRPVEKWELTLTVPGKQTRSTFQWYDPELKLAVREELPMGYVSELKNIRVGPQPDELFGIPAGYSRTTMPQAEQAPARP